MASELTTTCGSNRWMSAGWHNPVPVTNVAAVPAAIPSRAASTIVAPRWSATASPATRLSPAPDRTDRPHVWCVKPDGLCLRRTNKPGRAERHQDGPVGPLARSRRAACSIPSFPFSTSPAHTEPLTLGLTNLTPAAQRRQHVTEFNDRLAPPRTTHISTSPHTRSRSPHQYSPATARKRTFIIISSPNTYCPHTLH